MAARKPKVLRVKHRVWFEDGGPTATFVDEQEAVDHAEGMAEKNPDSVFLVTKSTEVVIKRVKAKKK
jgi:hypothetical protein